MEELTTDIQKVLKPAAVFSQLNSELFNTFPGLNQSLSCHVQDYLSINNILNNVINTNQPNEQLPFHLPESISNHHNKLFCTNDETPATASQSPTGFVCGGGNKSIVKNKVVLAFSLTLIRLNISGVYILVSLDLCYMFFYLIHVYVNYVQSAAGKKRKRKAGEDKEDVEKPKEVIHVRAKRGQATDSHSLAERVSELLYTKYFII